MRAGGVAAAGRAARVERSVWPVAVLMLDEDAEHPLEIAAVEDQEPVETLRSDGADKALGNRVIGVRTISIPSLRKTMSKSRGNLVT